MRSYRAARGSRRGDVRPSTARLLTASSPSGTMVRYSHVSVNSVSKLASDSGLPIWRAFCHAFGMSVSIAIRELEQLVLVRELAASGEARRIRQAAKLSQA